MSCSATRLQVLQFKHVLLCNFFDVFCLLGSEPLGHLVLPRPMFTVDDSLASERRLQPIEHWRVLAGVKW